MKPARQRCGGRIVPRCYGGVHGGVDGCYCDVRPGWDVMEQLTRGAVEPPTHWLAQNDNGRKVEGPTR